MDMTEKNEWLAIIKVGDISSWARGADLDEQVARVCRLFKSDWKRLYRLKKGTPVKVIVVDAVDHEVISWGDDGILDCKTKEKLKPHCVIEATLP